jgi:hypothetical protein
MSSSHQEKSFPNPTFSVILKDIQGTPKGYCTFRTGGVTATEKELQMGAAPTARKTPSRISRTIRRCNFLSARFCRGLSLSSNVRDQLPEKSAKYVATPLIPEKRSK